MSKRQRDEPKKNGANKKRKIMDVGVKEKNFEEESEEDSDKEYEEESEEDSDKEYEEESEDVELMDVESDVESDVELDVDVGVKEKNFEEESEDVELDVDVGVKEKNFEEESEEDSDKEYEEESEEVKKASKKEVKKASKKEVKKASKKEVKKASEEVEGTYFEVKKASKEKTFTVLGITSNKELEYLVMNLLQLSMSERIEKFIYVTDMITFTKYKDKIQNKNIKNEMWKVNPEIFNKVIVGKNNIDELKMKMITFTCNYEFIKDYKVPAIQKRIDNVVDGLVGKIEIQLICVEKICSNCVRSNGGKKIRLLYDIDKKTIISDRNIAFKRQICVELINNHKDLISTANILYTDDNLYGFRILNIGKESKETNIHNEIKPYLTNEIFDTRCVGIPADTHIPNKAKPPKSTEKQRETTASTGTMTAFILDMCEIKIKKDNCIYGFTNFNSIRMHKKLIEKHDLYKTFVFNKNIQLPNYDLRLQTQAEDIEFNSQIKETAIKMYKFTVFKMMIDDDHIKEHVSFNATYPKTDIVLYFSYIHDMVNSDDVQTQTAYLNDNIGLGYISGLPYVLNIDGKPFCQIKMGQTDKEIINDKSEYNYTIVNKNKIHNTVTAKIDWVVDVTNECGGDKYGPVSFNIPSISVKRFKSSAKKYAKFMAIAFSIYDTLAIINTHYSEIFPTEIPSTEIPSTEIPSTEIPDILKDTMAFIKLLLFAYIFKFNDDGFESYWQRVWEYCRDTFQNLRLPETYVTDMKRVLCTSTVLDENGETKIIVRIKLLNHGVITFPDDVLTIVKGQKGGTGSLIKMLSNTFNTFIDDMRHMIFPHDSTNSGK